MVLTGLGNLNYHMRTLSLKHSFLITYITTISIRCVEEVSLNIDHRATGLSVRECFQDLRVWRPGMQAIQSLLSAERVGYLAFNGFWAFIFG